MWLNLIALFAFLFMLLRNIAAKMEYNTQKKNALFVFKEHSRLILAGRIFAGVLLLAMLIAVAYDMIALGGMVLFPEISLPVCVSVGLAFFAFFPYSTALWTMNDKGIFVYNSNKFLPWSQIITTGIQKKKKKTFLVLTIKKEQGEFFKQTFYLLKVPAEQAEELGEMIRKFVKTYEKMKLYKHVQEERNTERKRRTWF